MAIVIERPTSENPRRERLFRGQPRWFGTLFMVDVWERFSFYGMTAILYLYFVAPVTNGGLGLGAGDAAALFGTYMSLMFIAALPGGWLADRVLGARRSVLLGGCLIAAGHYTLSVPARPAVVVGLLLVIAGTGLLKPAIGTLISSPYPDDHARREALVSIFYMSVQIAAFLAPIVTGFLGEKVNWHLGFGAAAVGMTFGLLHWVRGARRFGEVGLLAERPVAAERLRVVTRRAAYTAAVLIVLLTVDVASGAFKLRHILALAGLLTISLPFVFFVRLRRNPALTPADRSRLVAFVWMLAGSSVFWMLYAQDGSILSMFAKEHTDRGGMPASWFQSAHHLFILALAPLFARLWVRLGRRADTPVKFSGALLLGGLSFLVMAVAAQVAIATGLVSPAWLLTAYLLQVCGELSLAPIGIALAVQVAPRGFTNQYQALWWLFAALGAGVGGQLARLSEVLPLPAYFALFGGLAFAAGALLALGSRSLRSRLAG